MMAHPTPRVEDYTVGWICALPIEHAAAMEMLDEEHQDLPYGWTGTNVGTNPAATVASRVPKKVAEQGDERLMKRDREEIDYRRNYLDHLRILPDAELARRQKIEQAIEFARRQGIELVRRQRTKLTGMQEIEPARRQRIEQEAELVRRQEIESARRQRIEQAVELARRQEIEFTGWQQTGFIRRQRAE
ncbi:hypothetical protein GP486_005974 [Trichoglossum hirsutum]|uniref:Uncharacterized protein n=1 Tax=Trichoglossum hirsutum TaxID=265104 RepID=A0A9P8L8A3_9PEZI|nr:hypothetical protein GP486_005974 [Trichoglossum hirsutum]